MVINKIRIVAQIKLATEGTSEKNKNPNIIWIENSKYLTNTKLDRLLVLKATNKKY
jgi:hypothetical protein